MEAAGSPQEKSPLPKEQRIVLQRDLSRLRHENLKPADAAFEWTNEREGRPSDAMLFARYEEQQGKEMRYDPTPENLAHILAGMEDLRNHREAA